MAAIRMAQSLGLHVDQSFRQSTSQIEQQMRLRIWHTCIHLDRLLSMTFGRPSMIDKQIDVPIPALIDDEFLAERGIGKQAENVPCRLGLFVSSSPLLQTSYPLLCTYAYTTNHLSATQPHQFITTTSVSIQQGELAASAQRESGGEVASSSQCHKDSGD